MSSSTSSEPENNPNLTAIQKVYTRVVVTNQKTIEWTSKFSSSFMRRMAIAKCGFCDQEEVLCMKIVASGVDLRLQCQKCMNAFYDYGTISDDDILSQLEADFQKKNAEMLKQKEEKKKKKEELQKQKEEVKALKLQIKELEAKKAAAAAAITLDK
jgi:septal ring factor EnvC (AmiA/AmiB activator)